MISHNVKGTHCVLPRSGFLFLCLWTGHEYLFNLCIVASLRQKRKRNSTQCTGTQTGPAQIKRQETRNPVQLLGASLFSFSSFLIFSYSSLLMVLIPGQLSISFSFIYLARWPSIDEEENKRRKNPGPYKSLFFSFWSGH